MITPENLIFELDQSLLENGEDAVLRRIFGTGMIPFDVNVRINLRGYDPSELVNEITQQDQKFILSPTQITAAQWPGFTTGQNPNTDNRIPRKNDIIISTRGRLNIQAAAGIYVQNTLVRIEGQVRGS